MLIKPKTLLLILICSFTALSFSFKFESLFDKIVAKLENYRVITPQEKVYLQIDKPYYVAGQTIWFKGYLFDGVTHSIDTISKVLYVDLIEESHGKTVSSRVLKCDNGTTNGDILLPDSLSEGIYLISAYTNFMRNYDSEYFFNQKIEIRQGIVKGKTNDTNSDKNNEVADLQFFPEGGQAIVGQASKIGFKAVNKLGKGVELNGYVLENNKDTVALFQTEHLGMGVFNYTPEPFKSYTGFTKSNRGTIKSFPLPDALENGYILAVDNVSNKDKIKVRIINTNPKPPENSSEIAIVGHQRGLLCFIAKGTNSQKSLNFSIAKSQIPDDGIVQITLIDANGNPICERLIFNNQNNQIKLKITSNKPVYKQREEIELYLEATDKSGKPVEGNFSAAVTDESQIALDQFKQNLLSYILLSSDVCEIKRAKFPMLNGHIEQPAYYFDQTNTSSSYHLDILMMTQGWRKFNWKDMLMDNKKLINYYYEKGLHITGTALRPNGNVAKQVSLTLLLKNDNKLPQFQIGETDSLGKYSFYGLDFNDSTNVMLQGVKQSGGKNLTITIDLNLFSPKIHIIKVPLNPLEFDSNELTLFLKKANEALDFERKMKLSKIKTLNEVVVKAKKIVEPDSRKFYSEPNYSVKVDNKNCGNAINILQLLQGVVPGLQVNYNSQGNYSVNFTGITNFNSDRNEPLYLVDGVKIDSTMINMISPCDVESIDVLKGANASLIGANGYNGVIAILTKKGGNNFDFSKEKAYGAIITKLMGYNIPREFYAPKYNVVAADHTLPDFRATLFWNANIKTDDKGKATLKYWNTDASTKIRVIIEGMASSGRIGTSSLVYEVK